MRTLRDILRNKGSNVYSTHSGATLLEAAQKLVENHCGSLLVREQRGDDSSRVVGIITERDLLRAAATNGGNLAGLRVEQFMTTMLVTGSPNDTIEEIMGVMTQNRIRHLPVMDGGELAGMISIGDIVKIQHDEMAIENHYLKSYIQG